MRCEGSQAALICPSAEVGSIGEASAGKWIELGEGAGPYVPYGLGKILKKRTLNLSGVTEENMGEVRVRLAGDSPRLEASTLAIRVYNVTAERTRPVTVVSRSTGLVLHVDDETGRAGSAARKCGAQFLYPLSNYCSTDGRRIF